MPWMKPRSTGRISPFRLAVAVGAIVALVAPASAEEPPWEHAAKTFQTAMSRYRGKDYDQAAPLFSQFIKRHRTHEAVPVALYGDAGGKAGELLADFKGRYKDQLERHMEERAQKLFTEHRQTGEAVEATAMMVEYYLKRVVPEKRDAWMNRMLEGYPRHVRTEEALARQIEALRGANRDREMLAMLDIYQERFPGGVPGHWRNWRLDAYRRMKDNVRALAEARKMYEESAREGNYGVLERLYHLERQLGALEDSPAAAGGFWTEWGERLKGTRAGCTRSAGFGRKKI